MIDLLDLLRNARTIAVVGCSDDPSRTSYAISRYLKESGYRMIPINPNCDEIHGETCYPDLESLPEDAEIDIVNIFRHPRYAADMVRMAVDFARARGQRPAVWTQLGVSTTEARRLADEAGLPYVHNRCILVEHSHLHV